MARSAHITGGTISVSCSFYMATLPAIRFNPAIRDFYQRLRAQGKAPKVAITAAMRKLLIIANAIIQQDRPWANHARQQIRLLSEGEGGYDADFIRKDMEERGGIAMIPTKRNRLIQLPVDPAIYALRNMVERWLASPPFGSTSSKTPGGW